MTSYNCFGPNDYVERSSFPSKRLSPRS
ncbi:hypothetical protein SeMB42_g06801, partial [Synchytrium endobioticum]